MLLVVDIGNTVITLGVFDQENIVFDWKIASDSKRTEDEYGVIIYNFMKHANLLDKVDSAVISSVVLPLTQKIKEAIEKYLGVDALVVTHKLKTNLKILLDKPEELGADRLANAVGALKKYGTPAIIVDFGTATSFDIIDKQGNFVGGLIAPGLKIQAESLSRFTSKLPKVKIETPKDAIGKNTIDAMLSGLVRGHGAMISGMISQCEKELGEKAIIIATGGYSDIINVAMTRQFDYIDKELTLSGTKYIFEMNKK